MLHAVQRYTASQLSTVPSITAALHTTTPAHLAKFKKQGPSVSYGSRTRLTQDLKAGANNLGKKARLEIAPREKAHFGREREHDVEPIPTRQKKTSLQEREDLFSREPVPHAGLTPVRPANSGKFSSFRRPSRQIESREKRSGRLQVEVKDESRAGRGIAHVNRRDAGYGSSGHAREKATRGGQAGHMYSSQHREHTQRPPRPDQGNYTSHQKAHTVQSSHKVRNLLPDEFYHPPSIETPQSQEPNNIPSSQTVSQLPTKFTSPPLMPGILSCLKDMLGPGATPTPIQSLSLKWLLEDSSTSTPQLGKASGWKQFLLASETGSGKSIAYLLPVLQNLKQSELGRPSNLLSAPIDQDPQKILNPRALILAPTHELARQLSGFAKTLLHEVKMRVLCASRANVKNTKEKSRTSRAMVAQFEEEIRKSGIDGNGEFEVKKEKSFPVDVVVGTPMKLLEMVRGRGWDRKEGENDQEDGSAKPRRGRDKMVGFGKWRSQPEMGLANVEWVVVDEADVLFDPDFQETTRQLLSDISQARGAHVPFSGDSVLSAINKPPTSPPVLESDKQTIEYPFNLILTSATIPSALASYLDKHHPKLMRLASPNLHHLPRTLQTEYVNWTGGNKYADIERRIRRVWAEDSSYNGLAMPLNADAQEARLSKILIFCNKSSKVEDLGSYLEERGIKNVALTSTSEQRKRGSNQHLDGFLRAKPEVKDVGGGSPTDGRLGEVDIPAQPTSQLSLKEVPHVMITTSLLSRGLDFSPSIRHVFIVDEPRNMIDFLHRAGRAGRAGEKGKVVIFGKLKGRGSASAKDVRKRVGALVA